MKQRLEQSSILHGSTTTGLGVFPAIFCTTFLRFTSDVEIVAITFSSSIIFTAANAIGISCIARIQNFTLDPTNTALVSSVAGPGFGTAIEGNSDILLAHWASTAATPSDFVSNKAQGIVYPKDLRPQFNTQTGIGIFWFSLTQVTTSGIATIYYRRI